MTAELLDPNGPSRARALSALLDIVEPFPMLMPDMAGVILDIADVPDREAIMRRVRESVDRLFAAQVADVPVSDPGYPGAYALPPDTWEGAREPTDTEWADQNRAINDLLAKRPARTEA